MITDTPTSPITINGGALETTTQDVTLSLDADMSKWTSVSLQNAGDAWSDWKPYASPSVAWKLSDGYGLKTVNVKFMSGGVESSIWCATITYVATSVTGTWLILKTPDYDDATGSQTSYLRLGAPEVAVENGLLDWGVQNASDLRSRDVSPKPFPGWFEYTDGDRTVVVRGQNRESVEGDETVTIGGKKIDNIGGSYRMNIGSRPEGGTLEVSDADPIFSIDFSQDYAPEVGGKTSWRKRVWSHASTDTYTFGDAESFYGGYKFDGTFGLTSSIFFGGKVDIAFAASASLTVGYAIECAAGVKYSLSMKDIRVADFADTKARKEISLRVKEHSTGSWYKGWNCLAAGAALAGASVAAGVGAAVANRNDVDTRKALGGGAGAYAALLAVSVLAAWRAKSEKSAIEAEIKMDKDGVAIRQGVSVLRGQLAAAGQDEADAELFVGKDAGAQQAIVKMSSHWGSSLELRNPVTLRANENLTLRAPNQDASICLDAPRGAIDLDAPKVRLRGWEVDIGDGVLVVRPPPPPPLPPAAPAPPAVPAPVAPMGIEAS